MLFEAGEKLSLAAFGYATVKVTYSRNGVTLAADVPAKPGKTAFDSAETGETVRIDAESRDWIFRSADLTATPQEGDRITTRNGEVFAVVSLAGSPCWRWHSQSSEAQKRVHSVRVETNA